MRTGLPSGRCTCRQQGGQLLFELLGAAAQGAMSGLPQAGQARGTRCA
jgi:hypothetical protein